jgi:hypothetical protein
VHTLAMSSARPATRMVEVNMTPGGRVHESGCKWLTSALANGRTYEASYRTMPANQVPAGKKHCSHC